MPEKLDYKEIYSKVINHIKSTSCHGVGHFANAPTTILKIFWSIFTIFCAAAMVYFLKLRIRDFINRSISTSINYVPADSLDFPVVSVCLENSYDDTFLYRVVLD